MKKTKLTILNRVSVFLLMIGMMTLAWGCGDRDWLPKGSTDENTQDKSVVQTEWKSENTADMPADNKKTLTHSSSANPLEMQRNSASPTPGKYLVQIGAFLDKNNAERLVTKLKQKGVPATLVVTEKDVKQWHIVRIGAFEDKNKAIETAGRYTTSENAESAVLFNGKVVKLLKSDGRAMTRKMSSNSRPKKPGTADQFTFQVGGLMTQATAKKQHANLQKKGYSPFISKVTDTIYKETWYTVRMGRYFTIDEAAEAAAKFAAKEDIPAQAQLLSK